jgi:hypothetical protein
MDFIADFNSIVLKAISRFSEELNANEKDVWIQAKYYNDEVKYGLINFPAVVRELEFTEILGKKIDLLQKGYFVGNFIQEKLSSFAEELNCGTVELSAIFIKQNNDVKVYLYKDGKMNMEINLKELI